MKRIQKTSLNFSENKLVLVSDEKDVCILQLEREAVKEYEKSVSDSIDYEETLLNGSKLRFLKITRENRELVFRPAISGEIGKESLDTADALKLLFSSSVEAEILLDESLLAESNSNIVDEVILSNLANRLKKKYVVRCWNEEGEYNLFVNNLEELEEMGLKIIDYFNATNPFEKKGMNFARELKAELKKLD